MAEPVTLSIPTARLGAFADGLVLRDPRARSLRPALFRVGRGADACLEVRGPFVARLAYRVRKEQGRKFAEATGDTNPIHTQGDIVPGALTASKALLPLELLFPGLGLDSFQVTFTGICSYDLPTLTQFALTPLASGGLAARAMTTQEGRLVAALEASAEPRAIVAAKPPRKGPHPAAVERVSAFLDALGVDASRSALSFGMPGPSYPRAFLASLPSGEMVKRLSGQGGLLNRLTLEFERGNDVPLSVRDPEVRLELPARLRRSFNKIVAWIREGLVTYARGSALVLPRGGEAQVSQ